MGSNGHALLACEYGRGFGHVFRLVRIANELAARGWSCSFAACPIPSATFSHFSIRTYQLPPWTRPVKPERITRPSATLGDSLASLGLADSLSLRQHMNAAWTVAASVMPDLIIADAAPAMVLACTGRIPTVTVGNGYFVVPAHLSTFPLPIKSTNPVWDESFVLETINAERARHGLPRFDTFVRAMSGDMELACTNQTLDPYAADRQKPVLGPVIDPVPLRRDGTRAIFIYGSPDLGSEQRDRLVEAAEAVTGPREAYIPGLSSAQHARLGASGCTLHRLPLSFEALAERTRLAVHAGGPGMASAFLAMGVPQVILHTDIEKMLNAGQLTAVGVAREMRFDLDFGKEPCVELINTAYADLELDNTARSRAPFERELLENQPAVQVVKSCETLV